ncbi:Hypp5337 [Branchiostoma lanceolatum]|uniref:Hypp5337 protein n=1 Tax=Branchiostoma lanceolatum TaxID=7740 RepID=A0A8K0AEK4_BRALA|nr:Hypp5337 [Branchiostoma lanceolatum]
MKMTQKSSNYWPRRELPTRPTLLTFLSLKESCLPLHMKPPPAETANHQEQQPLKEERDLAPTLEEVTKAVDKQISGKAAGVDGIPPEIWKHGGAALHSKLHEHFVSCWEQGKLPQDLRDAVIITLYKNKGEKADCSNYRGITLPSIAGKILARVLLNRLVPAVAENHLPESQCGFKANRGTTDMYLRSKEEQVNKELTSLPPDSVMTQVRGITQHTAQREFTACKERQVGKYQRLKSKHDNTGDTKRTLPSDKLDKWVINSSDKELSTSHKHILGKGLNFALTVTKIPTDHLIICMEQACRILKEDSADADELRAKAVDMIKKPNYHLAISVMKRRKHCPI